MYSISRTKPHRDCQRTLQLVHERIWPSTHRKDEAQQWLTPTRSQHARRLRMLENATCDTMKTIYSKLAWRPLYVKKHVRNSSRVDRTWCGIQPDALALYNLPGGRPPMLHQLSENISDCVIFLKRVVQRAMYQKNIWWCGNTRKCCHGNGKKKMLYYVHAVCFIRKK